MNSQLISRKIAFLGPDPKLFHSQQKTEDAFALSGKNTGNHAFWHAVDNIVMNEKIYIGDWNFDPEQIGREASLFVIPSSNFLHEKRDLGGLAHRIERTNLPLVVIGLGSQIPASGKLNLSQGTIRFLDLLKERSLFTSVRGETTANILTEAGVENIEVLGCPSNLINLNPSLGAGIERKIKNIRFDRDCTVIINSDLHRRHLKDELVKIMKLIDKAYFELVAQNPLSIAKLGRMEFDMDDSHVEFQRQLWKIHYSDSDFRSFARQKYKTFFNAMSWMDYLTRFKLSVGTRFHGNMLAFQSEVPALFVTHDSRTSELVKRHSLPFIHIDDLNTDTNLLPFESVHFSGEAYDEKRQKDLVIYRAKFAECGLSPSF